MKRRKIKPRAALLAAPAQMEAVKPSAAMFKAIALEQVVSSMSRMADPDFVLAKAGMGRHELRKLEADDEISAAIETRREAACSTPWRLEPLDDELREALAPHMDSILRGAWSAVPFGYSVLEVVYRQDPGGIGIDSVQEKPIEWFEPTRDGKLKYTAPGGSQSVEVDTLAKFILTRRNATYRNPYGEALLSRAYWPWFFRMNGWRFWMKFLELFAEPLLLGKVHDPAQFVSVMQGLGLESVVGVGQDESIQAITPAIAGEFERADNALCRRIQKLILGQTLTTDVGDSGSYAAAKVHDAVRDDKRRADVRLISASAQRVIDALWALNGRAAPAPMMVMQDDVGLESERAARDALLVEKGVLKLSQSYLLERYDYREGDIEAADSAPTPPTGANMAALMAAPTRMTADQALLEGLMDESLRLAESPIPVDALRSAILGAKGTEDMAERMAKLYRGQSAKDFRDLVEKALFTADVLGYVAADTGLGEGAR